MVETLDRNVGRILETLDRIGIADDTIIIFTSDNGGLATAEGSPTTNHPLSEGKGWMEEGGNRVPFIVRWPGVTDRPNAPNLSTEPIISPDIYPTVLSAASMEVANEQDIDGENLQPLLEDSNEDLGRRAIFWHYPHYGNQGGTPASAIRAGNWKLVEYFEDDHVELYHLGEDVRENRDLSQHCPEKADELRDHLNEWRESVGARLPEENPDYEPWNDRAGTH